MPSASRPVTFRINDPVFNAILRGRHGPIAKELLRRGLHVETLAKRKCPVEHGRLRNSIHTEIVVGSDLQHPLAARVKAGVHYARFVHDGTGIYGPHNQRIVPTTKSVLAWKGTSSHAKKANIKRRKHGKHQLESRGMIFATSTKGMKGTPFLVDALKEAAHHV